MGAVDEGDAREERVEHCGQRAGGGRGEQGNRNGRIKKEQEQEIR